MHAAGEGIPSFGSLEVCARWAQIPPQRKEKAEWDPGHNNLDSAFESARGSASMPVVPDSARWSMLLYRNLASMAPGFVFEYRINAAGKPEAVWASDGVESVMGCTLQEVERRGGWDAL